MSESHKKTKYYRESAHRIFVNRDLDLGEIKFFGFDMDYTLAVYKSPAYESLCFEEHKQKLIDLGYSHVSEFTYDASFPVRGLWFDKTYGNLLKVGSYGNILDCVHGFKTLEHEEILRLYPNQFIKLDRKRCHIYNTLFELPETYMLACLIDYFSNSEEYTKSDEGLKLGTLYISYSAIFQDVRDSFNSLFKDMILKNKTTKDIEKYIQRDERLPTLLEKIKNHGAKNLLLTNSDYIYTDKIMKYLLETETEPEKKWTEYFDFVVVDAKKPHFFEGNSVIRQVDQTTGSLSIGCYTGESIQKGQIYSGGSCSGLLQMIGASGKDVLYIGDHIYGDILKSKKEMGWRTFLIIPELKNELEVWKNKKPLFDKMYDFEVKLSNIYKDLDSSSQESPNTETIRESLKEVKNEINLAYSRWGSLCGSGSQQTFFAAQAMRYADLYSASITNMLYYPFFYSFLAPRMLMPHEPTVSYNECSPPAEEEENNLPSLRVQPVPIKEQTKSPLPKRSKLN